MEPWKTLVALAQFLGVVGIGVGIFWLGAWGDKAKVGETIRGITHAIKNRYCPVVSIIDEEEE